MFDYSLSTDKRDRRFMPTAGYYSSFFQEFQFMLINLILKIVFQQVIIKNLMKILIGALKFGATAINGIRR